jgi:RNA polymerase sigma factor (sigma-70 family)
MSDADDVAQEALAAFAEAYRSGQYDRERGRLSRWLFGIAYRHVLRHRQCLARKDARRSGDGADQLIELIPDEKSAEDVWNTEWERAVLHACMTRVRREFEPETIRAFEAGVRDDRPAAEVAEELGVSVKQVYNAKHRVLSRLRALRSEMEETV